MFIMIKMSANDNDNNYLTVPEIKNDSPEQAVLNSQLQALRNSYKSHIKPICENSPSPVIEPVIHHSPTDEMVSTKVVIPTDVTPVEVTPTEVTPTEVTPTEEVSPTEVTPTEVSSTVDELVQVEVTPVIEEIVREKIIKNSPSPVITPVNALEEVYNEDVSSEIPSPVITPKNSVEMLSEKEKIIEDITSTIVDTTDMNIDRSNIMKFVVKCMELVEKYSGLSGLDKSDIVKSVIKKLIMLIPGIDDTEARFLILVGEDLLPSIMDFVVMASKGLLEINEHLNDGEEGEESEEENQKNSCCDRLIKKVSEFLNIE